MPAPRGIPHLARNGDDPTVRKRVSMARSTALAARTAAISRRMSVSGFVERLIWADDVDESGRPRWAAAPRAQWVVRRSSADPTRQVQLTLARSTALAGRQRAAATGMSFSGYVARLIRRELARADAETPVSLGEIA